jgi:hypothetical protein
MWWPFWHFEVKFKTNRCKVELKQREWDVKKFPAMYHVRKNWNTKCGDWTQYLLKKYKDRLLKRKYLAYFNRRNSDGSHKLTLSLRAKVTQECKVTRGNCTMQTNNTLFFESWIRCFITRSTVDQRRQLNIHFFSPQIWSFVCFIFTELYPVYITQELASKIILNV